MVQTNRLSKSNLVGHCEIDLFEFLTQVSFIYFMLFESEMEKLV